VNSRIRAAGQTSDSPAPPIPSPLTTRSAAVIASMLLKATIGLSFQRMFFTARVTLPFSIRNRPSRVRPVTMMVCGSSGRMYQKRVTRTPRSTPAIRSSRDAVPPCMIKLTGPAVGSLPCFSAQ
jgi:hypothetical protein